MYGGRHTDEKIATHSFFQGAHTAHNLETAQKTIIRKTSGNKHVRNNNGVGVLKWQSR